MTNTLVNFFISTKKIKKGFVTTLLDYKVVILFSNLC